MYDVVEWTVVKGPRSTDSESWKLQYTTVEGKKSSYLIHLFIGKTVIDGYRDQSKVFLFSSNVEYSGVREFPVSNCRFHFERVEKLVFSLCRHLDSLRVTYALFTLEPLLLIA